MAERKILKRWEILILILIGFILLTALLKNLGINVINTKEETEVIHHTRKGTQ